MSGPPLQLRHVILGGYTADQSGRATGVSALLNTADKPGSITLEPRAGVDLVSPSYLLGHPTGPWVFAASESDESEVASLRIGDLTLLSRVPVGGADACHLALTRDGRFLVVSNYSSGSIATFAVREDGTLTERIDLLAFEGSGPDADRQAGSHAHQAVVDGDELLVCDLGTDQIHRILVAPEDGVLGSSLDPIELPAGSGPRHLVLVEDFMVVVCELSAELWFARRTDDGWEHLRTVSTSNPTAPRSADGSGEVPRVEPSGIVAAGYRVFVGNRGPDTISVFDIEPGSNWIAKVTEFPSGGAWPRDLTLSDGLLWVSNERSDQVAVFEISPLPPTAPMVTITAPTPTCVLLVHDREEAHP